MATTMQPTTGETTRQLVNYRTDGGVAVIEMCDPPANTYTYEMNRQLDEAILRARMDNDVYVILLTGAGDKFFSAGANKIAGSRFPCNAVRCWMRSRAKPRSIVQSRPTALSGSAAV